MFLCVCVCVAYTFFLCVCVYFKLHSVLCKALVKILGAWTRHGQLCFLFFVDLKKTKRRKIKLFCELCFFILFLTLLYISDISELV